MVVGIFANEAAITPGAHGNPPPWGGTRLVGALLLEQNDERAGPAITLHVPRDHRPERRCCCRQLGPHGRLTKQRPTPENELGRSPAR